MRLRHIARLTLIPFCLFLWAGSVLAAATDEIPWDKSLTISRTSSDEDIKDVLRSLLQVNGFSAIFGPNVAGKITFRLDKVPVHLAFEQLIEEHHLSYSFNPAIKTVTVNALSAENAGGAAGVFVPLDRVNYDELTRAMASFSLPARGLKYDPSSRTVALSGGAAYVQQISDLIKTLEAAHQKDNERVGADRLHDLELRKAELAQRTYEELKNFQVKVIQLRFTDVGPTAKQFQGRSVTIPGIADTLSNILGLTNPNPQAAVATPAAGGPDPTIAPLASVYLGEAQQLGHPRISIDQRTNSVVVQGTADAIAAVEKVVHELDRPLRMVEIEVVIANADLGVARQLGVDWRGSAISASTPGSGAIDTGTVPPQIGNDSSGKGFNTTGLDALSLLPIPTNAGTTAASFVVKGANGVLQAQLQALASKDRARILSAPRLITLDNITARITRSQNIYVQVDTRGPQGTAFGGVGLQEIQTGLTLEITPSIVPSESNTGESLVRLNLRAENSAPGAGVFGQIDVKSQEVQTNVLVPDGATFVIGGLFDDSSIINETGVPGLKDIPVLGALFRNKKNTKSLGETIFFITPHMIDERTVLQDDIAVKVGSEEYIRRQRHTLDTEVHDTANASAPPINPSMTTLEEDE